jgi:hypothetical protein
MIRKALHDEGMEGANVEWAMARDKSLASCPLIVKVWTDVEFDFGAMRCWSRSYVDVYDAVPHEIYLAVRRQLAPNWRYWMSLRNWSA